MSKIICVQWELVCDNDTGAINCLNNINNALTSIVSVWENKVDKNESNKGRDVFNPNKWVVGGIMRMSNPDEKTTLINIIKGLGNSPHIVGKIRVHPCSHFQWKCVKCEHVWDSEELPTFCPNCGNSNPVSIVGAVEPCVVTDEIEVL